MIRLALALLLLVPTAALAAPLGGAYRVIDRDERVVGTVVGFDEDHHPILALRLEGGRVALVLAFRDRLTTRATLAYESDDCSGPALINALPSASLSRAATIDRRGRVWVQVGAGTERTVRSFGLPNACVEPFSPTTDDYARAERTGETVTRFKAPFRIVPR